MNSRYKTELCRPFEETGRCKYDQKCQYAHGSGELRSLQRHPKYKTVKCHTYHKSGICPYGQRCNFIHSEDDESLLGFGEQPNYSNQVLDRSNELEIDTFDLNKIMNDHHVDNSLGSSGNSAASSVGTESPNMSPAMHESVWPETNTWTPSPTWQQNVPQHQYVDSQTSSDSAPPSPTNSYSSLPSSPQMQRTVNPGYGGIQQEFYNHMTEERLSILLKSLTIPNPEFRNFVNKFSG